jgi:riboflavin kinase/FMN adenylyltransferase|tara:strand:+ start:4315 stop:5214 length:900 start_codon:yes stop_codon:yes gene_type:complete
MNIYENFQVKDVIDSAPITSSIGAFDGIHLGHRALFTKAMQVSNKSFQIVTFNKIPKVFFNKNFLPLLDIQERISIFRETTASNLIFLDFESVNDMTPLQFCNFLKENLKTNKLVIGKDFKFGKERKGDIKTLLDFFGPENIFLLEDYLIESQKVSTTKIRDLYANGNIQAAQKLLGRKITFSGKVIKGKQLGSSIGIPTANIKLPYETQLPKYGVYAVNVHVNGIQYLGCLNIGINPTVDSDNVTKIEIHILHFDKNIYDHELTFELLDFIRDEQEFDSVENLKSQILKDISKIKKNF